MRLQAKSVGAPAQAERSHRRRRSSNTENTDRTTGGGSSRDHGRRQPTPPVGEARTARQHALETAAKRSVWLSKRPLGPGAQLPAASTLVVLDFDCTLASTHMFSSLRSKEGQQEFADDARRFFVERIFGGGRRLSALDQFLARLRVAGATLIVLSNGCEAEIEAALRATRLRRHFSRVYGRESFEMDGVTAWSKWRLGGATPGHHGLITGCIGRLEAALSTREKRPSVSDPIERPCPWSHAAPNSPVSPRLTTCRRDQQARDARAPRALGGRLVQPHPLRRRRPGQLPGAARVRVGVAAESLQGEGPVARVPWRSGS